MTAARRRRRSRRWAYWLVVLVLVAVAAGVGYKVWEEYFQKSDTGQAVVDGTKDEEPAEKPVEPVEPVSPDGNEEPEEEEIPETKPQYDGANPNTGGDITGVITYAGVSDAMLMIRVNIDQYLAGGNCELTLARDGAALYSESARVADSAATSTCEGFNVPVAKVGSGKIGIRILVTSGERSGIIEGEADL